MVQAFTHTAAMVEAEKGGKFRLLGGNVYGEFQELVRICLFILEVHLLSFMWVKDEKKCQGHCCELFRLNIGVTAVHSCTIQICLHL